MSHRTLALLGLRPRRVASDDDECYNRSCLEFFLLHFSYRRLPEADASRIFVNRFGLEGFVCAS